MEANGDEQPSGVNEVKENGESEKVQEEDTDSTLDVKRREKFCMFTEYYLVRILFIAVVVTFVFDQCFSRFILHFPFLIALQLLADVECFPSNRLSLQVSQILCNILPGVLTVDPVKMFNIAQ